VPPREVHHDLLESRIAADRLIDQEEPLADAALFQLWPGVFVGTIVESRALRPDMYLHLYILAFNLSGSPQAHTLIPAGYKIPEDQRGALGFVAFVGPHRPAKVEEKLVAQFGGHALEIGFGEDEFHV